MAGSICACIPSARSSETRRTKITSGQYNSGRREVKERQNWPQVMIDHILKPEPLYYDEMEWASPLAEMTGFKSLLILNGSSGVVEVSEQEITAWSDKVILFPMI